VRWRAARAASCALAVLACAHAPAPAPRAPEVEERPRPPPVEAPARPRAEVGLASYYSRALQGRRTASGTRYDGRAMTCAHRSLPFGTVLRVTDLESGRSVVVRVNDRGPFAEGRVVDLSLAAARELGILERGVARVKVEKVAGPDEE
jgi:peptidoglycan lytic transglycosylase